jgi:hypothetical protein
LSGDIPSGEYRDGLFDDFLFFFLLSLVVVRFSDIIFPHNGLPAESFQRFTFSFRNATGTRALFSTGDFLQPLQMALIIISHCLAGFPRRMQQPLAQIKMNGGRGTPDFSSNSFILISSSLPMLKL